MILPLKYFFLRSQAKPEQKKILNLFIVFKVSNDTNIPSFLLHRAGSSFIAQWLPRFQYNMVSSLQPTQINTFAKHWTDFQVTLTLRKLDIFYHALNLHFEKLKA